MKRQLAAAVALGALILPAGVGAVWARTLHSSPKTAAAATSAPLPISGGFSCLDQHGGKGGKEMGPAPQIQSLNVERQADFDRLIFQFAPGPGGVTAVPMYQLTQKMAPKFPRDQTPSPVVLAGSAGLSLWFGNLAAVKDAWQFKVTPASLVHTARPFDYSTGGLRDVREIALLGYFQPETNPYKVASPSQWGIGLETRACLRVTEWTNPVRLVIDIDTAHAPPAPGPLVFSQVTDASFVDAAHGWLLGLGCVQGIEECRVAIQRTSDGGQHWTSTAAPVLAAYTDYSLPWHLRFTTASDGWLYGSQVYVTHDGGDSWTPERRLASVEAIAPSGSSLWALTGCPVGCVPALYRSQDGGGSWELVNLAGLQAASVIARGDALHGWILNVADPQAGANILRTVDGGSSWQPMAAPCTPFFRAGGIAASSASDLWIVCGGQPGAGQQQKQLYRSSDGGMHWTGSDLSWSGYFADIAVTSPSRAWLAFARGPLEGTSDGGRTWRVSIDTAEPGMELVRFVDGLHGWAATNRQLYRTLDGGAHWTVVLDLGS